MIKAMWLALRVGGLNLKYRIKKYRSPMQAKELEKERLNLLMKMYTEF